MRLIIIYKFFFIILLIKIFNVTANYKFDFEKYIKEIEGAAIIKTDLTFLNEGYVVKTNGKIEQLVDFDDDWKLILNLYRADFVDGKYELIITTGEEEICKLMQSFYKLHFYDHIKNYANAPLPDKCPVTKATYLIKDFPFDAQMYENYLFPGFYKIEVILKKDDKEILKHLFSGHLEEVK